MKLHRFYVSPMHRDALEREVGTLRPVFSIPVRNQTVEYAEYYTITEAEFGLFMADPDAAKAFAARCGRREMDDRLILQPGTDRGHW
ncbi:hypothetical protein WDZ92_52250 [Nostoc sp. NIES-2111]